MTNFLVYNDAEDFIKKSGLTVEAGLITVEVELQRLKTGGKMKKLVQKK